MSFDLTSVQRVATHTVAVTFADTAIEVDFRGLSVRATREVNNAGGYVKGEGGETRILPPEYLSVFVKELRSGDQVLNPDLNFWLDATPSFVDSIFSAVYGAQYPPKATDSESETT